MKYYALTGFFLKISYDDSVRHTASSSGVMAAAAGVCCDVWVGTEREHSKEVCIPQELRIPVLLGDHLSLGFRFGLSTTQRKAVILGLNMHPLVHPQTP